MTDNAVNAFGTVESTHTLWKFFVAQIALFRKASKSIHQSAGERWAVVAPLAYSATDTCDSIAMLAQAGRMRDCFVLGRTAFETITNICFILAKGDETAARAQRHARQKAYRDLSRKSEINGAQIRLEWSGEVDLTNQPELQAALNEFTSAKGREITSWTPETTAQQIEAIGARFGPKISSTLHFALLAIYRHGSEIAHGTFFGALFALGMTNPNGPPDSPEALQNNQRQQLSMIMMLLGMSLSAAIEVFTSELPVHDLAQKSRKLAEDLRNEPWVGEMPPKPKA